MERQCRSNLRCKPWWVEAGNPKAEPGSAGTPAGVFSATNASQLAGRGAGAPEHSKSRRLAFGFRNSDLPGFNYLGKCLEAPLIKPHPSYSNLDQLPARP